LGARFNEASGASTRKDLTNDPVEAKHPRHRDNSTKVRYLPWEPPRVAHSPRHRGLTSTIPRMTATSAAAPSSLAAWKLAIRPKTLPAAISPVVVGSAVAFHEGGFVLIPALACLAVALLLQIASNLANDVLDFRKGADTSARLGPTRVTQAGLLTQRQMGVATGVVLLASLLIGVFLVWRGGWPFLVVGVLAIISAVAYTGGPYPLGYNGLGEVFVFLFFGLAAVIGTAYVQTLTYVPLMGIAAVPVGLLITAILVVNNLRDIETDRRAGKHTLAARFGRPFAIREYAVLLAISYAVPVILFATGLIGIFFWLPLLTLPIAISLTRRVATLQGPPLNPVLGETARLGVLFAIAFAGAIIL